jgi:uncharacterized protein (TIGR02453 family)
MLQTSTLRFLKALKKNNNKPWFDAHRSDYEVARNDFAGFIQAVIDNHGRNDSSIKSINARDCLFRINRDIRFSKDKSPYKTNMGAYINRGGKKSIFGGYYFHCEPGESFAGGGLWMPMPSELNKVRQEIDYNFAEFKKIINSRKFKSIYGQMSRDSEYVLTRVPRGYDPANPAAEYIKMKSFVSTTFLADRELSSKDLVKRTVAAFGALQPLVEFINKSIG